MPRLFVVFRTYDRIWDSAMYSREQAYLDMDNSDGEIQFIFQNDQFLEEVESQMSIQDQGKSGSISNNTDDFYLRPHHGHIPIFFGHNSRNGISLDTNNSNKSCCQKLSLSVNDRNHSNKFQSMSTEQSFVKNEAAVFYYVLPCYKCTVIADAHVVACMHSEYRRSKTFRKRFFRKIQRISGFRDCRPEYKNWTHEEGEAWDFYLSIPFMIDIIAVWPWQKVDYAWCGRMLNLLNKHVVLEESLAWLSTLGGAHSSLGDTFVDHAKRAGEISIHQLRLARELGNEIMIARCYLYWAWSLLQRDYFAKCKICIINTWRYVKKIKCSDKILMNMCKAVWGRLQYKRSLLYKSKVKCSLGSKDSDYRDSDGSGCGVQHKGKDLQYSESVKRSRLEMQSVEVC